MSPPIDAGFYLSWLPDEHRRRGHHLTALIAEDATGDVIARQTFRLTAPGDVETQKRLPDGEVVVLPTKALAEQARRLIDFRAENGKRQTLWLMPTTEGGYCYLFNRGGGCPPKGFKFAEPLAGGISGGSAPVLYFGQVRDDVALVELRYQDGDVERVEPTEGFILHEIRSGHYGPGTGVYPCDEPVDQGYGTMMCP